MKIEFTKMHGLGNDYIFIDCVRQNLKGIDFKVLARKICHRNLGIGADGIILILKGQIHPFEMRIYNSDGTQAEMCGNGMRCFARYLYESGFSKKKKQITETLAGPIETEIVKKNRDFLIKVNMGRPVLSCKKIPIKNNAKFCVNESLRVNNRIFKFTAVSIGNPHAVIFVKEFDKDWQKWGKLIENHIRFPQKTNVEFVKVLDRKTVELKVWERGAGATLACGTGACAAIVAGVLNGKLERKVKALFIYGHLEIDWDKQKDSVFMIGPAEKICDGTYDY